MGLFDFLFSSRIITDEEDDDIILSIYDTPKKKKKEHYCPRCGSWMFETRYSTWECSHCDTEREEAELEDEE